MPLTSDLQLNSAKFTAGESEHSAKLNLGAIETLQNGPRWYEVGAAKYRQMRWNGETPLPKVVVDENGINFTIPSRDSGRDIPCRMFQPSSGTAKGVFLHIHGGGWVLQSEHYQDNLLRFYADSCNVTVISVGYRLAPEDPYPAGANDCYDAAEYFVDHAKEKYGSELMFTGGESAGGHLACLIALHLLKARPSFSFRGLVLNFGCYDLSCFLPSARNFSRPLILDLDLMEHYIEVLLPNTSEAQRRDPAISPYWADLKGLKLPPAIFVCGTEDPLLDDSVLMCAKWQMNGAEGILKVYPGAPHGFIQFPLDSYEAVKEGLNDVKTFILDKMT